MTRLRCILLCCFVCVFAQSYTYSQTKRQFNGQYVITYVYTNGGLSYDIKGLYTDPLNSFSASQAIAGDIIIDSNGNSFKILSVSVNGTEISTTSTAFNEIPPVLGSGVIYRPTESGFPLITVNTPPIILASALNSSTLSIDDEIPDYSSGANIPLVSWNEGDVVFSSGEAKLYKFQSLVWHEIETSSIPGSFAFPATSEAPGNKGDIIVSFFDGLYYVFDGSAWVLPTTVSSLPTLPSYGDVFYNTTEKKLYMMGVDGEWACISSSTMAGGTTSERPTTTIPGDFYFSTDENILYLFDTNNKWVEVSVNGSTPTGIINPDPMVEVVNDGDLFFNTSDHRLYVYNGTSWVATDNLLGSGQIYVGNNSNVATPVTMSGDALITNAGKITIQPKAVTNEKLDKQNIPLSGFGNPIDNVSFGDGTTNNRIVNLANPIDQQDAVTKGYVMSALSSPSNFLVLPSGNFFVGNASGKAAAAAKSSIPLSGFGAAAANVSLGDGTTNFKIVNMANPTANQDAATKYYVDTRVISPNNLSLPTGNVLIGSAINTATPVAKNTISVSDFGAATADVLLGNGTLNFKIGNLANPTLNQDAATKNYVDNKIIDPNNVPLAGGTFFVGNVSNKAASTLKSAIPLSGFGVATADVSLGSFKLTDLAAPVSDSDAANKKYIDDLFFSPSISLALPSGTLFMGNGSGKAAAVAKNTIPVSAFGAATTNVNLGNATTQYNISFLADPMYDQDAATKKYVDDKVANPGSISLAKDYLLVGNASGNAEELAAGSFPLSNFGTATDDLVLGNGTSNFKIINLADPTDPQDAATKKYVDDLSAASGTSALADGKIFVGNVAGVATPVSLSGDVTIDNAGKMTITDDAVSAAKLNADVAGSGLKQNGSGALEVDVTTIAGGSISSADLLIAGGSNAALTNVVISIPDKAITNAKLDKANIPLTGFGVPTADLSAGSFKITNLSDPTVDQDATTKKYVDDLVAGVTSVFSLPKGNMLVGDDSGKAASTAKSAITLSGFKEAEANISMGSGSNNYKIINLADPSGDQDAATKKYVDNTSAASKDNLGNHTATGALKMGSYSISNDGDPDDGVAFDTDGHATFGKDVTVNGNFYTPSDERLKTHIETLTTVLEKINGLRGVQFEYKDQKKYAKGPKMGVIAQELLLVYPEMVTKGDDGYLKVDYTQLTAVLIQAVKEQQQQIKQQQQDIDEMKVRLDKQQQQINSILRQLK